MSLIGYAIGAIQQRLSIFPCNPAGTVCPESGDVIDKQPHLLYPGTNKPYKVRWPEEVTSDLDRVIEMWTWSPLANPAVAARQSGLLILDCDIAKAEYQLRGTAYEDLHEKLGPWVDGHDVLRAVCERHGGDWEELNATYRVTTGSMGLHLYFSWPPGVRASQASIVKGSLDVRGNGGQHGGYVLGAGSVTSKGRYVAENATPIAPAPRWLVELCREKPPPPKPLFAQPRKTGGISGLVETVRNAEDGNLNNATLWAARAACGDSIPIDEAIEALANAYASANGRGGYRQGEATVRSGYRLQERKGT
ncbi:bifunctional DNA primase/polymerase [Streptomyces sp. OK228]|uniref:bifunctional DNA primase/polymerase n=1 Tax=Streptomyces sp. OK228 TaxID=1882786 RepID=UPI000BD67785|nr:bifunctional DNA primase/polymerase [Streptomyces sp. OK228]SOE25679.1 Bifunctional DNA primase/polymerase, N-terminal [Streptomyces sp. OK228]